MFFFPGKKTVSNKGMNLLIYRPSGVKKSARSWATLEVVGRLTGGWGSFVSRNNRISPIPADRFHPRSYRWPALGRNPFCVVSPNLGRSYVFSRNPFQVSPEIDCGGWKLEGGESRKRGQFGLYELNGLLSLGSFFSREIPASSREKGIPGIPGRCLVSAGHEAG